MLKSDGVNACMNTQTILVRSFLYWSGKCKFLRYSSISNIFTLNCILNDMRCLLSNPRCKLVFLITVCCSTIGELVIHLMSGNISSQKLWLNVTQVRMNLLICLNYLYQISLQVNVIWLLEVLWKRDGRSVKRDMRWWIVAVCDSLVYVDFGYFIVVHGCQWLIVC